jgi:glutathione S-transferase
MTNDMPDNLPTITIYGKNLSRAVRCLWVLEEMGLEYRQVPIDPEKAENQTPEYLAINSSGKIPALVEGDFVLTESMAINLYLAAKKPGVLLPDDPQDLARVYQWTLWAVTEVENYVTLAVREMRQGDTADQASINDNKQAVSSSLPTLEGHLEGAGDYLLGDVFTLADLNTASVMCFLPMIGMGLDGFPKTAAWMQRCLGRDAWKNLQG